MSGKIFVHINLLFFSFPFVFSPIYLRSITLLASSSHTPVISISLYKAFHHDLPFPLFPCTRMSLITLTASVFFLLKTCFHHLNVFFNILSTTDATPILPLTALNTYLLICYDVLSSHSTHPS